MKKLLSSAAMFLCCVATSFAQFSGSGNGTEDDPYLIFNENQLAQVSNFLNQEGVVFKLMKDIDLTNWIADNNPRQGWIPIGVESSPFKGIFEGNNHKIKGLMINRNSTNYVGFFGFVSGATIENLTIEGSTIVGATNVGGFVGKITGSVIANCNIKLTGSDGIKGSSFVGSFAGSSYNTNYSVFNALASVSSSDNTGGYIGYVDNGTFTDGIVSGSVVGSENNTGGLIGHATGITLTNILVKSMVSGQDYTGGLMGYCATGNLSNCKYEGTLTGRQYVGGISGSLEMSTTSFENCFTRGEITATGDYAGGLVGVSKGGCIEKMDNCSHFGDLKGESYLGGLIGAVLNVSEAPVLHTYELHDLPYGDWRDRIMDTFSETMRLGNSVTKTINNCTTIGNIVGLSFVGGLIGCETTAIGYSSTKNYNSRYYVFEHGVCVGGNGFVYYTYTRNTISLSLNNSYYSGTIHGLDNIGGLYGYKSGGEVLNNYAYAIIYGASNVGGIAGMLADEKVDDYFNTTTIKSNVANNSVISATTTNVGRIYGTTESVDHLIIGALASAEGNRALAQTQVILSGIVQEVDDDFQNGSSIGPAALKLKANYVSWGWDFDNDWNILETQSFPYKKYQAAPPVIESQLVSKATSISGKSINGGTVYLYYKNRDAVSTVSNDHNWSFSMEPLQSGAQVSAYTDVDGMTPSYFTISFVGYPGSGTKDDPYRIYTAEDLQGASNRGYYKVMNDIDLSDWIKENSPTKGWSAIGRNSGEITYIDGDNHKVTGLWMDTNENYNGLFSNFSAGQIKNLTVEVASGKKVKGGDYTGILIGRNANGSIVNCTVKGDAEGTIHAGGVAGYVLESTIRDVLFNGSISCSSDDAFVGGLAGQTEDCTISSCIINATVYVSGMGSKTGGLIGEPKGCIIKTCSSHGSVNATGEDSYTGGLIGYALSDIENCYSTAKTTGTLYTAGLVGYTFNKVDKCYAKGDVYGSSYGAGLVGELDGTGAVLTNSVASNNIISLSDQSSWGCRVIGGYKNGAPDPDNSNYALSSMQVSLNNVPQKKTDDILEGRAMAQEVLLKQNTYTQLGWDFTNVWEMTEGVSYPTLQASATGDDEGDDPDPNPAPDPNPNPESVNVTDISNLVDAIYAEAATSQSGNEAVLTICLKNAQSANAYSFDLKLPAGVSLVTNSDGDYQYTLSNRHNGHAETINYITSTGVYSFAVLPLQSKDVKGNDGVIWKIRLKVAENVANGDYAIKILNAKYSLTSGSSTVKMPETIGKLTIGLYKKGDVNGDGDIDIADAVCIVNHVVGIATPSFVAQAADVNGDGDVDIADAVRIINLIVGKINALSRGNSPSPVAATRAGNVTDAIYIENASAFVGKEGTLTISLKNAQSTSGYSFEMILPEGVSIAQDENGDYQHTLSERHSGFMSTLNYNGYNTYTLAALSLQKNKNVEAGDGAICTFKIKVDESTDGSKYPVTIKNAKYSLTSGASKVNMSETEGQLTVKIMGDANGDFKLDQKDVTAIVNHIMGDSPDNFDEKAADMNGDEKIDVTDIVLLNKLLGKQ